MAGSLFLCDIISYLIDGENFGVSVQNDNFAEKTLADCSGTSNYYVGVATKFCEETFHGWF